MMSKTAEICICNGVKVKQDEIENAVKSLLPFSWKNSTGKMYALTKEANPYSLPTGDEYDMTFTYTPDVALGIEKKDAIACMLDYVMSSLPANVGLEEPSEGLIETCFPPGHYDMENICLSNIGPPVLEYFGYSNMYDSALQFPFESEMITPDMSYSYHGKLSFLYGYDFLCYYHYNLEDDIIDDDLTADEEYIMDLCYIIESLGLEKGKGCSNALCGLWENESDDSETKFPSASL
eukprot:15365386-Ditylum_brightwellii.AAC.1